MSSCLIITQGNKMYIGADTACSVKTKDGYKRISNDMPKLFTLGNSVFFCSGKKADAERCVNWIFDNFERSIDFDKLGIYLRENFNIINEDNVFNIEFLLCDYDNHSVIQLSQYNNFEPVIYDYAEQVRIICGGYKTNDSFTMAKKNIALNESVFNIYKNVFEAISDECVGGDMIIYNSPTNYETYRLEEKNISYCNINENNLFLLTSDFVTSGVINGSQIIGGDIYSTNYSSTEGSHINLLDGSFTMGGGALSYDKTNGLRVQGNGTFTGIIYAKKGGTIGGFTIGDTAIYNGTNSISSTTVGVYLGTDGIRNYKSNTANVTIKDGVLSANGANIAGTITTNNLTATSGKIANFTISGGFLYNGISIGTAKSCGISCGTSLSGNDSYIFWAGNDNFRVNIHGDLFSNSATITGGRLTIGDTFSVTNEGVLSATGATISGKLTAGDGSRLGSGSYIGSNTTTGWKITNNQIHTVKTISDGSPIMSFNAGDTADNIFIIAPNCFQIGGRFIYGDVPSGEIIGANFTKKVYISGGLKVTNGDCVIGGNCSITGAATASNLSITGGNIAGWKINENYLGADDCFIRADGRFTFRYMVNNSTVGSVSFAYNSNTNRCRLHLNNDCDFVIGSVSITEEQLRRLLALL